jgi:hypothetical protein
MFGLVETQGFRQRFEDGLRDAVEVAAFETGVVLHAHASEHRDLAAP